MRLFKRIITFLALAWLFLSVLLSSVFIHHFHQHSIESTVGYQLLFIALSALTLLLIIICICLYYLFIRTITTLHHDLSDLDFKSSLISDNELTDIKTKIGYLLPFFKSINVESHSMSDQIIRLTNYDALTSLPNINLFREMFSKATSNATRSNRLLALMLLQITPPIEFEIKKDILDTIIKELSVRYTTILRGGDLIARYKPNMFVILLHDIKQPKFAASVAEKLIRTTHKQLPLYGKEISVNASIGICIYPTDAKTVDDCLIKTEEVLKHTHINNYHYISEAMSIEAHEHFHLQSQLSKAIEKGQLTLFFQPQLDVKESKILSVEALVRWNHPELGIIPPDKFIGLAEETGLIMELGEWVLNEACRINKKWQTSGFDPVTVAVNISPTQFYHQDILKIISTALEKNDIDPKYLEIEVTESAVMDDLSKTVIILNDVNTIGVRIAIDDFGTGYTSINYLKKFPVDVIKIDKTFVKGIHYSAHDRAIVSAIIALGHNLGMLVVAEGIESHEQLSFLNEHECDFIQGDLIGKAIPADEIVLQFTKK